MSMSLNNVRCCSGLEMQHLCLVHMNYANTLLRILEGQYFDYWFTWGLLKIFSSKMKTNAVQRFNDTTMNNQGKVIALSNLHNHKGNKISIILFSLILFKPQRNIYLMPW